MLARTVTVLFSAGMFVAAATAENGVQLLTPETIAERASRQIYVGSDRDMPLGGEYRLAIQPRPAEAGLVAPNSIIEGLRAMRSALPNWYVTALQNSSGNTECSVVVNNVGYGFIVSSWMWVHWAKQGSPVWDEFQRLSVDTRNVLSMQNTLGIGLCELVKTNDEQRAMEYVAFQARIPLVQ